MLRSVATDLPPVGNSGDAKAVFLVGQRWSIFVRMAGWLGRAKLNLRRKSNFPRRPSLTWTICIAWPFTW